MKTILYLALAAVFAVPVNVRAYGTATEDDLRQGKLEGEHETLVEEALQDLCGYGPKEALCEVFEKNLPFLKLGAYMEDNAYPGYHIRFEDAWFQDELWERGIYDNCKEPAGKYMPACNHFYFYSRTPGESEGAVGPNILGATNGKRESPSDQKWDSARARGDKLYKYALSGRPDGFFWLGRVAHLLADMGVPGHVISHPINFVEVEHRVYEYRNSFRIGRADYAAPRYHAYGRSVPELFHSLAKNTYDIDSAVRMEMSPAAPHPLKKTCSDPIPAGAATAAIIKPAYGRGFDALSVNFPATKAAAEYYYDRAAIEKAILEEDRISYELGRNLKPLVVEYIKKLFRLAWEDSKKWQKERAILDKRIEASGFQPVTTMSAGSSTGYPDPAPSRALPGSDTFNFD